MTRLDAEGCIDRALGHLNFEMTTRRVIVLMGCIVSPRTYTCWVQVPNIKKPVPVTGSSWLVIVKRVMQLKAEGKL